MCCALCSEFDHLDADDARAEREATQDSEFNALVEAERNGDEPIDFDPNDDLRWGEPSRA